jgi:hypothetical protein
LTPLYRCRAGGLRPPARLHANPSPDSIEEGDHGNTGLYLGGRPPGNAQVGVMCGAGAVSALLEMVVACGIGFFLGFVLKATCCAARISWSQERMLRQARAEQAEAARARENAGWQLDPYDRIPL